MHDIDRTVREFETAAQYENAYENAYESPYETAYENNFENAYENNYENAYENNFENNYEYQETSQFERPVFDETQEMQLATELLESMQNEQQMEEFFGKLLKKAASAAGKFIKGPIGSQLVGALKGVAKTALPMAGAALGNMVLPGVGGAIGGKLATMATKLFEMELEGMSTEDQEFAVARRVVRLGGTAARNAASISSKTSPVAGARAALALAARRQAPGLLPMIPGANRTATRSRRRNPANRSYQDYPYSQSPQSPVFDEPIDDTYPTDNYLGGGSQTCSCGGAGIRRGAGRWYKRGKNIVLVI